MKKTIRRCLFPLLFCLLLLTGCEQKAAVKLQNASFESGTDGWKAERYTPDDAVCDVVTLPGAPDGNAVARLTSGGLNDIRFTQTVKVKKGHCYLFSASVRTEEVAGEENGGACLAVMDTFLHSDFLTGSNGWTTLTLPFKATKSEDLTLAVRLGFFGSEQAGTAYFDAVSVRDVSDQAATGTTFTPITHIGETEAVSEDNVTRTVLLRALLYAALTLLLLPFVRKKIPERLADKLIFFVLGAALLLRGILAVVYRGFTVDINCFWLWGERMAEVGPFAFYEPDYFCDYPPLYMLVCGGQALLAKLFGLSLGEGAGLLLLKLPAILCDVLSAFFIYRLAKKHLGDGWALALGTLYAFAPAAVFNSAVWGQVDGVFVLLMLLCLDFLDRDNFFLAAVIWFVAFFTKPQTVLFGPVMLFATVREFCLIASDRASAKRRLIGGFGGLLVGVALFFLFSLTMANGQPFTWLFDKYFGTLGSYDYASLNSFGLLALLGGQWVPCTEKSPLGLPYGTLGTLLVVLVLCYAAVLFILTLRKSRGKTGTNELWLLAVLTVMGVVVFAARSHERYLFPVVALLIVSFIRTKDVRLLYSLVAAGILSYVNAAAVLYRYEGPGGYMSKGDILLRLGSLLTVALFCYVAYVITSHLLGRVTPPEAEEPKKSVKKDVVGMKKPLDALLARRSFALPRVKAADVFLVLAITAVYAFVALSNLGDTKAAQSDWMSSVTEETTDTVFRFSAEDYVVADFGEPTHIDRGYYYTGVLQTNQTFYLAYSADGVTWTNPAAVEAPIGGLFCWHKISPPSDLDEVRYVAVMTNTAGLSLMEMGFFEHAGSEATIPIKQVISSRTGDRSGAAVFDEQSLVPTKPTYMNGMYFDEIYHARTGYETAHEMPIYEVSHPPLGKDFISLSIRTFGMTPFAWRFPGAMAGILMLPVIYFIGLFLFRRRPWATVLTLLMALDGMHFVQTRIATVDSFAVLFILLMFLFMLWYRSISFYDQPLWKTFIPLGLCGISFGFGAASKWIGIYAGAGLAVLFFLNLFRRYTEYRTAKRYYAGAKKGETKDYLGHIIKVFPKYAWLTIGFCVVFFVLIPGLIYLLSYIPYARAQGETRSLWTVMVENQKYMYQYHSTLRNDPHKFQSDWYTWPFIYRPVWMYTGTELTSGMKACISSFGNPAVWYAGLVGTIVGIGTFVYRLRKGGMNYSLDAPVKAKGAFAAFFDPGDGDITDRGARNMEVLLFLLIGVACNLLPWLGVGRSTFLYHYFATTPFIMMFTVFCLRELARKKPSMAGKLTVALLLLSLLFFVMFKPVWTGTPVSADYITTYLKWFDSWYFSI